MSIATSAGALNLAATDTATALGIDVAGTASDSSARIDNGSVLLRAPRMGASEVAVTDADIRIAGAARIDVEAFKSYSGTNVGTMFTTARNEATTFMTHAADIETRLGA